MSHIQGVNSKLWYPESTYEKVDSEKMFILNIVQLEEIITKLTNGSFTVGNSTKVNGFTIIDEAELSVKIDKCNTPDALISQIPNKCMFIGNSSVALPWFPPNVLSNDWLLVVTRHSDDVVYISLTNMFGNDSYTAKYNGSEFIGWYISSGTNIVATATIE